MLFLGSLNYPGMQRGNSIEAGSELIMRIMSWADVRASEVAPNKQSGNCRLLVKVASQQHLVILTPRAHCVAAQHNLSAA